MSTECLIFSNKFQYYWLQVMKYIKFDKKNPLNSVYIVIVYIGT